MYADLTRAVGPVMVEVEEEEEEKPAEDTGSDQEGAAGPVAVRRVDTTLAVKTTGRQKFGDTRTMKFYGMESPILAEFQK